MLVDCDLMFGAAVCCYPTVGGAVRHDYQAGVFCFHIGQILDARVFDFGACDNFWGEMQWIRYAAVGCSIWYVLDQIGSLTIALDGYGSNGLPIFGACDNFWKEMVGARIGMFCAGGQVGNLLLQVGYHALHDPNLGLLFGAVFMLTDPVTSPTSSLGKIIFAIGAAMLTMLIRVSGSLPEGVVFSIVLMNLFVPIIDSAIKGRTTTKLWKQWVIIAAGVVIAVLVNVGFALL